MADILDQARQAAEWAERAFLELDEASDGRGFDVDDLRKQTRETRELLRLYRSGELASGAETGEFIEAGIFRQEHLLRDLRERFPKWLAEEQARITACLAWVAAENACAAARARQDGDRIEQQLADELDGLPASAKV